MDIGSDKGKEPAAMPDPARLLLYIKIGTAPPNLPSATRQDRDGDIEQLIFGPICGPISLSSQHVEEAGEFSPSHT